MKMITDRNRIREGMTVYSSDGEKLGKVVRCDEASFIIEKGFFFPKDYVARYADIADVTGDDVRLSFTRDSFAEGAGARSYAEGGYESQTGSGTEEDIRVPVSEEELDVVKRDREAGEVRLHKEVITEKKQIEVPVTREEVRVERGPVSGRDVAAGDRAFQDETVSMPLHEEEVEIRKRPVVKEEVRLKKERVTEQRAAEADLRKERVEIEGEGGVHRTTSDPGTSGIAPMRDDDDLK
jgi:uncharacterized protein (TIGR02271 family)